MSEERTDNPTQQGSGTFKDPEKRARVLRSLQASCDFMGYSLRIDAAKERRGDEADSGALGLTFEGTDRPISLLFQYFENGKSYKDFLATHPMVKEEDVLTVIEATRYAITGEGFSVAKEMIALRKDVERLNQNSATNFKRLAEAIKDMLKLR